ncbi:MAG: hypothetical protein HYZ57_12430, partial [Acidobacteria bacterium]|nr:hypothetical protein [Acidobacteriota bacterium]
MPASASPFVILGEEIESRIAEERARLRRNAGLEAREHFRRPRERAFTAAERDKVT